jgi:hypothetical protein
MPNIVYGNSENRSSANLSAASYEYAYPRGLNLKPLSPLHEKLKTRIMQRAKDSHSKMQERHKSWNAIDDTLTAYMPLDEKERMVKGQDSRKPVSIVVPMSYATLETILTYMAASLLESPIFRFNPVGPEDAIGTILLEKHIERQCERYKSGLALHTFMRDGFAYGVGATTPIWTEEWGTVRQQEPIIFNTSYGTQEVIGMQNIETEKVIFEGNRIDNVNPYLYLPDPNVAIQDVQRGEYVGWVSPENRMNLLEREESGTGGLFNVKYVKHIDGKTTIGRGSKYDDRNNSNRETAHPIDVVYMYVNLIPQEWGLGDRDYPEKWFFALAGDEVIIAAQPLGLYHNRFPVAVCAPDYDGYSITPLSRMEMVHGLQEVVNWLFNSHITNVRKAINDMLVVDPSLININDLENPGPGKLIRIRKAHWGRGVQGAVQQLAVNDITRQNIGDSTYAMEVIKNVSGATDTLQGVPRQGSERVTAEEFRGTRGSALSRLQKAAKIISMQGMQDLGYLLAAQTQQLASQEGFIRTAGRWEDVLRDEYGIIDQYMPFTLDQLSASYDIAPYDGTSGSGDYAEVWSRILQTAASSPELMATVDIFRVFKHWARLAGAKNVDDFRRKVPPMQAQVLPTDQVMNQVQMGNMVPVSGGMLS